MKYIATFDFGTTAVKGALVETGGKIRMMDSRDLNLVLKDGFTEQNPTEWIEAFREITGDFRKKPNKCLGQPNICLSVCLSVHLPTFLALLVLQGASL